MLTKSDSQSDAAFLLDAYARIAAIRAFEESCLRLSTQKDATIAGSVHLCAGQEAVPVGAMAALRDDDQVVATYRGHGWALESGVTPELLFAEVSHKSGGINGGRAGSAMVIAPERFLGENSIVAAGAPIGCGAALAAQAKGDGRIVVVSFGDGATSQGALHEAMVFAVSRNLPVLFVCENNGWSEMTPMKTMRTVERLARRANAYGMQGVTIDGTDPKVVRDTVALAAEAMRGGSGPALIECLVPRLWGHYNRDIEHYRPAPDRQAAAGRDPLVTLADRLVTEGLATTEEIASIRAAADDAMSSVERVVAEMPLPDVSTAADHVLSGKIAPAPGTNPASNEEQREMTFAQAANEALRRELASRPEVLVYGEDVGNAGGIFGVTRYLQREFGSERVFDTPIAESAILGSAVGSAICGMRPVVEIMWADFMLVALDQLINQAANVSYLTRGQFSAPMVVRTQQGATPGSCAQHSQSLEALLAHIPGLYVGLPTTAQDAYSMLRSAVASQDPCIIIEARALYQQKGSVALDAAVEAPGRASVIREGSDVALVGWGTVVPKLIAAAELLATQGVSAAVLDLRWLNPLDTETLEKVVASARGRVVVAHDATMTGGFGAEILARLTERYRPGELVARRVATPDSRIPASPQLQSALLPDADKIVRSALDCIESSKEKDQTR